MSAQIDLAPVGKAEQLFVLLHGVGGNPESMLAVGEALQDAFPRSAVVIPPGFDPFDGGTEGRQWFSTAGITEADRPNRVAAVMPRLVELVRREQAAWEVPPIATALVGFSQGAIMSLEAVVAHDGLGGRVVAFAGRFARLPAVAPQWTTIHLLHGADDSVIPARHAEAALQHLAGLQGDVTMDIASGVGHTIHPALVEVAIDRLRSRIPLRSWQRALGSLGPR